MRGGGGRINLSVWVNCVSYMTRVSVPSSASVGECIRHSFECLSVMRSGAKGHTLLNQNMKSIIRVNQEVF